MREISFCRTYGDALVHDAAVTSRYHEPRTVAALPVRICRAAEKLQQLQCSVFFKLSLATAVVGSLVFIIFLGSRPLFFPLFRRSPSDFMP